MLVSLMTTAVDGNNWDLYESPVDETIYVLCRCPLVRRDPRGKIFSICSDGAAPVFLMAGWADG